MPCRLLGAHSLWSRRPTPPRPVPRSLRTARSCTARTSTATSRPSAPSGTPKIPPSAWWCAAGAHAPAPAGLCHHQLPRACAALRRQPCLRSHSCGISLRWLLPAACRPSSTSSLPKPSLCLPHASPLQPPPGCCRLPAPAPAPAPCRYISEDFGGVALHPVDLLDAATGVGGGPGGALCPSARQGDASGLRACPGGGNCGVQSAPGRAERGLPRPRPGTTAACSCPTVPCCPASADPDFSCRVILKPPAACSRLRRCAGGGACGPEPHHHLPCQQAAPPGGPHRCGRAGRRSGEQGWAGLGAGAGSRGGAVLWRGRGAGAGRGQQGASLAVAGQAAALGLSLCLAAAAGGELRGVRHPPIHAADPYPHPPRPPQ